MKPSIISNSPLLPSELERQQIFYWLKRISSVTAWLRIFSYFQAWARAVEDSVRVAD
nr:Imm71 family immunity protein [Duganella callida]